VKILCIADIHGDTGGVIRAAEYAKAEMIGSVLILGDFPAHGCFHSFELSVDAVKSALNAFKGFRVYAIPGNCDLPAVSDYLTEKGVNIHERIERVGEYNLAGFGGSNTTPFDTPFELDEELIYSRLDGLMEKAKVRKTILALHSPPKDTLCDKTNSGLHVGSASSRRIIEKYKPQITLCSHIHEAGGSKDEIGHTVVANIGRLSEGRIGVLNLGKEAVIELLTL
jgi:Icc-related predicted phosphoesterase